MSNDLENTVTEYLISEHSLSSVICADLIYHARCLSSSDNNIQSLESIERLIRVSQCCLLFEMLLCQK